MCNQNTVDSRLCEPFLLCRRFVLYIGSGENGVNGLLGIITGGRTGGGFQPGLQKGLLTVQGA